MTNEQNRNNEIKLLAEYNIRLAVQAIPLIGNTSDIKQYVLKLSENYFKSVKGYSKTIRRRLTDCLWVDYELNDISLFKKHIMYLLNAGNEKHNCILDFISETKNTDSIIRIIKYISSLESYMMIRYLLSDIVEIVYLKDLHFKWDNEKNYQFIKILSKFYISSINSFGENYKFNLAFNVPKELINLQKFPEIRDIDIESIISLIDIMNTDNMFNFLGIILQSNISYDCNVKRLYERIINSLSKKKLSKSDFITYKEIMIQFFNQLIKTESISNYALIKYIMNFSIPKELLYESILLQIKKYINNPRNLLERIKYQQEYSDFIKQYFSEYEILPIADLINSLVNEDCEKNTQLFNTIIMVYLSQEKLKEIIDICQKNKRCSSILFIYLPIDFKITIFNEFKIYYYSHTIVRNIRCLKLQWESIRTEIIDLYKDKPMPLSLIDIGYSLNSLLYSEFIINSKKMNIKFDEFFIEIPDSIKIQLIKIRDESNRGNIFKWLSKNFDKHITINDRIYIPLDNDNTVFLECIKKTDNVERLFANGIVNKNI